MAYFVAKHAVSIIILDSCSSTLLVIVVPQPTHVSRSFVHVTSVYITTDNDACRYDGWDMSALLFSAAAQCDRAGYCEASMGLGRRDRYFYHSSEDDDGDLVAVRLGPWKLHFLTKGSHCNDDFPDAECYAPPNDRRSVGGLLFNVERDMSEVLPLSNTSYEYVVPSIFGAILTFI